MDAVYSILYILNDPQTTSTMYMFPGLDLYSMDPAQILIGAAQGPDDLLYTSYTDR